MGCRRLMDNTLALKKCLKFFGREFDGISRPDFANLLTSVFLDSGSPCPEARERVTLLQEIHVNMGRVVIHEGDEIVITTEGIWKRTRPFLS